MPGAAWHLQQTDELVTIRTPAVRIVFRHVVDRWTHEIGLEDSPPLIRSLESLPDATDPSRVLSPVYQEIQHHAFDDDENRVRLLLTGLLFRHHFSAVLTITADADGTTVDFDVADRCREPVTALAATYDVRMGAIDVESSDSEIAWEGQAAGDARLALRAEGGAATAIAERGPLAVQAQILARLDPAAFTHRLRYGWFWTRLSGRTR